MRRVVKRVLQSAAVALLIAAMPGAALAADESAPPRLTECSTVVRTVDHPYYGQGWLMECADGYALVVPTRSGSWAIVYPAGAELTGVPTQNPAWVDQMADGTLQPGPVLGRGP